MVTTITNVIASPEIVSSFQHLRTWITPTLAMTALAAVGLRTVWDVLTKRGWIPKRKSGAGSTSESAGGEVDMKIIEEIRLDLRRMFDKLDELQKTVLTTYATKAEVDELRVELRESRDKVIRLETEMVSVQKQLTVLPKRSGD